MSSPVHDGYVLPSFCLSVCGRQDETLVHCSLSTLERPDFVFDVEFDGQLHEVNTFYY